ncbi:hypothetical protein [Paludifilum halophilum]|uniref:Uncharacterized protein n=1 Tax=Paludifilum halophilum TaxID=1642702 RepID=A0A235B1L4_9BACL|nr:hypothetical protein [Paludifilum halophilum]OYD06121.1 hypothetical protein CHM34_18050 [Paludifilum halophilum]
MVEAILLGVIVGALLMLGAGLFLGIVIGNMWAQLDRRRFQAPPYRGKVSSSGVRNPQSVAWRVMR